MSRAIVCAAIILLTPTLLVSATNSAGAGTSLALRAANPEMLSGGLFSALDGAGVYHAILPATAIRAGMRDLSKGHPPDVLDARVGQNIRLGDDPTPLPVSQLGQAEPHLYRSVATPDLLLATFQEGRYQDGGAIDCGYAVSQDGGLTWTRALIPNLTQASGGRFNRATDPVTAIGPQGDMYLNTLGSTSGVFATAAVVVSRSSDHGATWLAPSVVFESTNTQISPDKNWMAVNDYSGTPNAGRLIVTWTNFTSDSAGNTTGNNLLAATSDDRGATWTAPVAITPSGSFNQGTQPVFLPDGSLLVVYVTFPNALATIPFSIDCKRSLDGGRTFPTTTTRLVASVAGWDDPELRDGVFLPSATIARQSGDVFVTYTAIVNGTPRVLVTKSSDQGATWSAPFVASDNPTGSSVMNPAVATSPDGRTVTVVFMDKRNASDGQNFIDIYAALSFDGGATWQPNIRVTDTTSDIRLGPPTTRGYMFGDYMAIAPALTAAQPCVAIWCDARTGDSDPFTARLTPAPAASYDTWRIAYGVGAGTEDPDGDGVPNALEYALATNPHVPDSGEALVVSRDASNNLNAAIAGRSTLDGQLTFTITVQSGGAPVAPLPPGSHEGTPPDIPLRAGLSWHTFLYPDDPYFTTISPRISDYTDSAGGSGAHQATGTEAVTPGTTSRLINVSTRGTVGTGANQMIVGFVLDGTKTMLIRAAGPALANFGITDYLANPVLTLSSTGSNAQTLGTNSAWTQSTANDALFTRVGAFGFPADSNDAALVPTLAAGSYTGVVAGANNATGTALVEAYDADATPGSPGNHRILNLSTRANVVAGGDGTLIAGFVIGGTQSRRVLIRAVGPSLAAFNLAGTLPDPVLTLYRQGTATAIASNDDWELSPSDVAIAATGKRLGAFALNASSLDAALLITLPPGTYTATVTSATSNTGIALVEVYDAD